jgi:hypothetical protein
MGTLTVPDGATKIIGVAGHAMGGPGCTTLEHQTGIIELETDDGGITPAQFLLDVHGITGTGQVFGPPHQWPCDIPVKGGWRIRCYITMDMAITLANLGRVQLTYA